MAEEISAQTIMTDSVMNLSWDIENFLHVIASQRSLMFESNVLLLPRRSMGGTDAFYSQGSTISGPDVIMPTQPKTTWKTFIDEEKDNHDNIDYVFKAKPLKYPELQKRFEIRYKLSFQDTEGKILREYNYFVYSYISNFTIREKFANGKGEGEGWTNLDPSYPDINSLLSSGKLMLKCCFRVIGCSTRCHAAPENDLNYFLDSFRALHSSKPFSDFTIVVDGKTIPVHKCILSSRSPVLAAMLRGETLETLNNQLVIKDFDFKTMETFISYLYTAELRELAPEEYFQLYSVSDKYGLESLKKSCAHKLIKGMNVGNVCELYALGYNCNDAALKSAAKSFLLENISSVLASEGWRKIALQNSQLAADMLKEVGMS
ncbi:TD and POZ domain-containing protein 5-like [Uloborus diversus]|uniref:TD and POZ domain-containing protein 5-like n=1 Tax=Uloborus diversus TaxID=327109 RepID=UPI002409F453|nr:TD and POZ domain-containing protein 5-like [Uloborus diversus]